jgi:hypothetical protein
VSTFRLTAAKLERFVRLLNDGSQFFFAAEVAGFAVSDLGATIKTSTGRIWQTPFGDLIEQSGRYRVNGN